MSLVELLAHPAARVLTLALLHFLWQGLAIAVLLVAAVDLCGVRRAGLRYAASLAALLAMLACPLATLAWLSLAGQAPTVELTAPPAALSTTNSAAVGTGQATWLMALQPLALAAWLAGVSVFGLRLLAGAIGLSYLRRNRQPLPLDLATLVERLGRRLQVEALPLVFISRQVSEAMAVGLVRPLVLIPAAWVTEMPLPMLEAVIAHELAHLRRRDLWINLLQRLAETLLFYHPVIWWLSRRLRTERELCADELAVAATGRRLEYAQALEQVAHRRLAEVRPALAAFMRGEANMRVLERVRNVLGLAGGERSRLWPVGLAALALPAALGLAAAGLRSATADEPKKEDEKRVEKVVDAKFFAKDGEKRDEIRRDEIRREGARDGEVKKDGPRDGEVRREGARDGEPRKDGPRDGEVKKPVARDVDVKKPVARDGEARKDAPRDGEARKPVARDGEVKKDAPRDGADRKIVRDGDRPAGDAARIEELSALVRRLSAQVEKLQAEVSALRGGRGEVNEKEGALRRIKEGGDKPAVKEGGDKPALKEGRREGDKPAAEGERREAESRKLEAIKRAAEDKEASIARERELIAKKRAAAEEAVKKAAADKEAAVRKEKEKESK